MTLIYLIGLNLVIVFSIKINNFKLCCCGRGFGRKWACLIQRPGLADVPEELTSLTALLSVCNVPCILSVDQHLCACFRLMWLTISLLLLSISYFFPGLKAAVYRPPPLISIWCLCHFLLSLSFSLFIPGFIIGRRRPCVSSDEYESMRRWSDGRHCCDSYQQIQSWYNNWG